MRVVVCVKQVPETTTVGFDPERGTLRRAGAGAILNPLDVYAIEMALRWAGDDPVIALSMGPPPAVEVLREALARGCAEAVLCCDPVFAGSDTWATAVTLAAAVRRLAPVDLVLCGRMAIDGDTAQVPPETAAILGWPQITDVRRLECSDHCLSAERQVGDGVEEVSCPLPAVVTMLKGSCVPRLPTLPGLLRARRAPIIFWNHEQLGLDPQDCGLDGSPTRVERLFAPPAHAPCCRHQTVASLIASLRDDGVMP